MKPVVSFGEALIDMLSSKVSQQASNEVESFSKFPGGAPANVAASVACLGGQSYFVSKLGQDMFGEFLADELRGKGVNTDHLIMTRENKTALAFVSLDEHGERSFSFYRHDTADMAYRASDFPVDLFGTNEGIFHFCSNTLTEAPIRETTLAGIELAKANGWLVSFDVNLRANLWAEGEDAVTPIRACLAKADLVKMAAEELEFIADGADTDEVIQGLLATGVKLILITDGGEPLRYISGGLNGQVAPVKAKVVDSTAAGDSFIGGFLYQLSQADIGVAELANLTDVDGLETMLRFASRCGAYTVGHKGAFNAMPSLQDISPV